MTTHTLRTESLVQLAWPIFLQHLTHTVVLLVDLWFFSRLGDSVAATVGQLMPVIWVGAFVIPVFAGTGVAVGVGDGVADTTGAGGVGLPTARGREGSCPLTAIAESIRESTNVQAKRNSVFIFFKFVFLGNFRCGGSEGCLRFCR